MIRNKEGQGVDGRAIVYCQGAFHTPNGKTAHGLVRFTRRYEVLSVIDETYAGRDAGDVLDGRSSGIPILAGLDDALAEAEKQKKPATHMVIGLAPDGGRLDPVARQGVKSAIRAGLHVDCGLHDYLSEDPEISTLAAKHGCVLRDIRKPKPVGDLNFFTGNIERVGSFRVAVLGTDSAVGKRTTAWIVVNGLRERGIQTEMIGTGQTAWLQGARYGVVMDSLVNDFVSGEIENVVWRAWQDESPDVMVIEGQGSLMNPAYPGGFEILAAARPHVVILQHAPARKEYDGFPGYPIQPIARQIQAIEAISGKPVVAVTINHENLATEDIPAWCQAIESVTGLPTLDVLRDGPDKLVETLRGFLADDSL